MNWRDSKYLRVLVKGACLFIAAILLLSGIVAFFIYKLESVDVALWLCIGMLALGTATLVTFLISEKISSRKGEKTGS